MRRLDSSRLGAPVMPRKGDEKRRSLAWGALQAFFFCFVMPSVRGQCSQPQFRGDFELSSADLLKEEFPEESTASFQCAMGYQRKLGSTKVTCRNGTWSDLHLKCERKSCGSPGEVLHGRFNLSQGVEYGAIVTAVCNNGYFIVGQNFMECTERGEWSGRIPTCEAYKCKYPPEIKNGSVISSPQTEFPQYGDVIEYKCDKDYYLFGKSLLTCGATGKYDFPFPTCEALGSLCRKPFFSGNVILTKSDNGNEWFTNGSVATFECVHGYERIEGSGSITCTAQRWSDLTLKCQKKSCGLPGEVLNGRIDTSEGIEFGAKAKVICNEGYKILGHSNMQCSSDGWTGGATMCEIVKCGPPPEIENGRIEQKPETDSPHYGQVIVYICDTNYTLTGQSEIMCGKDGVYSHPPPKCKVTTPPTTTTTARTTISTPKVEDEHGNIKHQPSKAGPMLPIMLSILFLVLLILLVVVVVLRVKKKRGEYRTREEDRKQTKELI